MQGEESGQTATSCGRRQRLAQVPLEGGDEIVVPLSMCSRRQIRRICRLPLLSALGSSEAAMLWRELRLMGGSGVEAKPKTCFVLPDIY